VGADICSTIPSPPAVAFKRFPATQSDNLCLHLTGNYRWNRRRLPYLPVHYPVNPFPFILLAYPVLQGNPATAWYGYFFLSRMVLHRSLSSNGNRIFALII
jgi:hypothetical protein